jgi:hypothetical protein
MRYPASEKAAGRDSSRPFRNRLAPANKMQYLLEDACDSETQATSLNSVSSLLLTTLKTEGCRAIEVRAATGSISQ